MNAARASFSSFRTAVGNAGSRCASENAGVDGADDRALQSSQLLDIFGERQHSPAAMPGRKPLEREGEQRQRILGCQILQKTIRKRWLDGNRRVGKPCGSFDHILESAQRNGWKAEGQQGNFRKARFSLQFCEGVGRIVRDDDGIGVRLHRAGQKIEYARGFRVLRNKQFLRLIERGSQLWGPGCVALKRAVREALEPLHHLGAQLREGICQAV